MKWLYALAILAVAAPACDAVAASKSTKTKPSKGHKPPKVKPTPKPAPTKPAFCSTGYMAAPADTREIAVARAGGKGWDERYQGRALSLAGARNDFCETFSKPLPLTGPIYAANRPSYGASKFDAAGGEAYSFAEGVLRMKAYKDATGAWRSGHIQSANSLQRLGRQPVANGVDGYLCTGCYFEAKIKFPMAFGGWGAWWLLTPNDAAGKHLELDGIEYYGTGNRRGHHHALHQWFAGKGTNFSGYTNLDAIADGNWHTHGVDLRGVATLDGKRAVVVYMDGKEVSRTVPADESFFTRPFYFVSTMAVKSSAADVGQTMEVYYISVWK